MDKITFSGEKLVIQPLIIQLLHNEVFMGPCRYGKGNDLTYTEEMKLAQEKIKAFDEGMKKAIDARFAEILDTRLMEWNEDFIIKEDRLAKALENDSITDVYLISGGMTSYVSSAIAQRTGKPLIFCPLEDWAFPRLGGIDTSAHLKAIGFDEVYNALDYDELNSILRVQKVRKDLRKTKALYAIRNNILSIGCVSSFTNLEDVKKRFGVDILHYNGLEFFKELDQATEEDKANAQKLCDELVSEANGVYIPVEEMYKDCLFSVIVNKVLARHECNAFTLPCFEMCATKELNKRHLMFCLTHSLLKDRGVASACASDIGSLVALKIMISLTQKSPHMGNCMIRLKDIKDNKMQILHDVCTRHMKGYNAPALPVDYVGYTKGNWGATMRYDFSKDVGETITLINLSPNMDRIMIGRGKITGCEGYLCSECTHAVVFTVPDSRRFYEKEAEFGHHFVWVYGDYTEDLLRFAKLMKLEAVTEI